MKYKHFYKKTKIYKEFGPKECKKIAYIFGHSLAVTDKDALKFIIDNNDEIVVFYHDEEQHAQQIANLVIILKKETLIDAAESVIEFRKQKERIYCKK